jgi:hypothetical protein
MAKRRAFFLLALITGPFFTACKGENKPSVQDTTPVLSAPAPSIPSAALNPGWDKDKEGPVVLIPASEDRTAASVVIPFLTDSALAHAQSASVDSLSGMSFELFDRTGVVGSARLAVSAQMPVSEGCLSWPIMTLEGNQHSWLIAFRKGIVTPLPLDSLEGSSSSDSLRMTTELARLASALPETNDPAFQGLPFAVRKAYRTHDGGVLIGDVIRKINEEANPREEHILIVAERSSAAGQYVTAFHTRSAGSEDAVRTTEILSAVRFVNGGDSAIFVSFGYEDGARIALIDRSENSWKLVWRSAYAGC